MHSETSVARDAITVNCMEVAMATTIHAHRNGSVGQEPVMEERAMEPAEVSSGFMVGLLFGAAVGAAMGLLFAPKSGRQMRRDLTKTARLARRRATDMYDDASDGFLSMVDSGRQGRGAALRQRS